MWFLWLMGCDALVDELPGTGDQSPDVIASADAIVDGEASGRDAGIEPDADSLPDQSSVGFLRLDEAQFRGSDNSYHLAPQREFVPDAFDYTHLPLAGQLDRQGIRHFDFDTAVADHLRPPDVAVGLAAADPGSLCNFLSGCLWALGRWADAHPDHLPIVVAIGPNIAQDVHPFLFDIQYEIRGFIGRDRLFVPDDLQGDHPTLAGAVERDGWPTVDALRGRFIFVLTDRGLSRDYYRERIGTIAQDPEDLMFTLGDSIEDDEAVFFEYEAITDDVVDEVGELIAGRRLVRTFVDDPENLERALALGAHFLSTRHPAEVLPPDALEGWPIACNSATAPDACAADEVDRP